MAEEEKKESEETGEAGETSVPPVPPVPPDEADAQSEVEAPAEPEQPAAEDKPAEPDWKALYALTLADFDNYKKRAARDREDTFRFAEMDILKDVLPAVDNLELALSNAKEKAEDPFVKGVQLVYDTLLKSLKDHGAEPFESVGKDLDTAKMEAIATLPSPDVPEGKVSIESKRGWMLKDKVLRAAQVVVSSGKPGGEE
ncbi:MAG: nucleotide exchange factor GrpE [Kiritimatiellae bacterium]|nr:nucleotide exchange factor GrpE [Kiritimatiellia bacterium]